MSRRFSEQAHGELRVARMLVQPGEYHASAEHARVATELILKAVLWLHQGQGNQGPQYRGIASIGRATG